jgi:hypothetical protein
LDIGLKEAPDAVDAVGLANVLNELRWRREDLLEEQVAEMGDRLFAKLKPSGRLLSVEPGSRWGGKLVQMLRKAGVEAGLSALAPCAHDSECPFLEKHPRSWCHFTSDAQGAPSALQRLTAKAKLEKESLALSFVSLGPRGARPFPAPEGRLAARVLSAPIRVPGKADDGEEPRPRLGRYACTEQGLALLLGAATRVHPLRPPRGGVSGPQEQGLGA